MELKPQVKVLPPKAPNLLIVPYGIETVEHNRERLLARNTFNCTLWN